jgi:glutamyl-tRNA synthetase
MGKDAEGNVSKLSKRHGSVSFENLVEEGFLPEAIVNYISFLGWNPKSDREIFSLSELAEVFSLAGLNKAPAVFDYTKLRWMNSEHLKMMESSTFAQLAKPFAKIEGTVLENKWPVLAELIRSRIETLTEIPEKIAFFLQLPEFGPEMYNNKKSKCTPEVAKSILEELIPQFDALEEFTPDTVNPLIEGYAAAHEVKLGQPMWAVRISLSGLPATPGGPAEIMSVLGKEESMRRLNAGLAKLG